MKDVKPSGRHKADFSKAKKVVEAKIMERPSQLPKASHLWRDSEGLTLGGPHCS
jgi:hypothetical protein